MSKQRLLFALIIFILTIGIILDFIGLGIFPKIIIIVGVILSIYRSINTSKALIERNEYLENDLTNCKNKIENFENKIQNLEAKVKSVEKINLMSQKHLDEIQKSTSSEELTSIFIKSICSDLEASKGVFFLMNNDILEFSAGFAHNSSEEDLKFEKGEGLVGQVAMDKRKMLLKEIPESYIEINSGLGKAQPKNIILIPVIYADNVLGLFEIATFLELSTEQIDLLEIISSNIATKLSSFKK